MARPAKLTLIAALSLSLVACGGADSGDDDDDLDGGGDPIDGGSPVDGSSGSPGVGEIPVGTVTPAASGLTDVIDVTLPDGLVSFIVIAQGTEGAMYQLRNLTAPDGTVLNEDVFCDMSFLGSFNGPNRSVPAESVGAFLVPDTDDPVVPPAVQPGDWSFQIEAMTADGGVSTDPVDVVVIYRTGGAVPAAGHIDLNLYFTGAGGITAETAPTETRVVDALALMGTHYAQAGISIGDVRYFDAPSELQTLNTITGADSDYSALLETSAGGPEGINIFLVSEIKSPLGGGTILGMAGGIPGPYLRQGTARSGIAIVVDPPAGGPERGTVWAHEVGHFLGLFHTTEMFAQFAACAHDPLADTGENDTSYVMYYTGEGGTVFSQSQATIMRGNPMLRTDGEKPRPRVARAPLPASRPAPTDPFLTVLGDLDRSPPKQVVDALGGVERLLTAAADTSLDGYRRERAVSLLEYYPGEETRRFLVRLAADDRSSEGLRRSAVFTLAFSYGRTAPVVARREIEPLLAHPHPRVRDAAVRALRWIDRQR